MPLVSVRRFGSNRGQKLKIWRCSDTRGKKGKSKLHCHWAPDGE